MLEGPRQALQPRAERRVEERGVSHQVRLMVLRAPRKQRRRERNALCGSLLVFQSSFKGQRVRPRFAR